MVVFQRRQALGNTTTFPVNQSIRLSRTGIAAANEKEFGEGGGGGSKTPYTTGEDFALAYF